MIAVDTSALMAILMDEPQAGACMAVLAEAGAAVISAGTLVEALTVAQARGRGADMNALVDGLGLEVVPVTAAAARRIAAALARWGKGVHPAGLNVGDGFAYEVAATHDCPLLCTGNDFARTDLAVVPG